MFPAYNMVTPAQAGMTMREVINTTPLEAGIFYSTRG